MILFIIILQIIILSRIRPDNNHDKIILMLVVLEMNWESGTMFMIPPLCDGIPYHLPLFSTMGSPIFVRLDFGWGEEGLDGYLGLQKINMTPVVLSNNNNNNNNHKKTILCIVYTHFTHFQST
jgi:hypothetical protein